MTPAEIQAALERARRSKGMPRNTIAALALADHVEALAAEVTRLRAEADHAWTQSRENADRCMKLAAEREQLRAEVTRLQAVNKDTNDECKALVSEVEYLHKVKTEREQLVARVAELERGAAEMATDHDRDLVALHAARARVAELEAEHVRDQLLIVLRKASLAAAVEALESLETGNTSHCDCCSEVAGVAMAALAKIRGGGA